MQVRRSAAIVGGVALVGAWLTSAAGLITNQPEPPQIRPRAAATAGTESLVQDVQAQAARLRDRLSRAPRPQPAGRNPFRFEPRRAAVDRPARPRPLVVEVPPATVPQPLPIKLEGVAEREVDGAKKRIAILSIYTTIFFAAEGESVENFYRVRAIGADVVQVEEIATGRLVTLPIR